MNIVKMNCVITQCADGAITFIACSDSSLRAHTRGSSDARFLLECLVRARAPAGVAAVPLRGTSTWRWLPLARRVTSTNPAAVPLPAQQHGRASESQQDEGIRCRSRVILGRSSDNGRRGDGCTAIPCWVSLRNSNSFKGARGVHGRKLFFTTAPTPPTTQPRGAAII